MSAAAAAVPYDAPAAEPAARTLRWDPLLVCLSAYIFASVGRIHQLFPEIGPLHPALVGYAGAVVFFFLDRNPERRLWPVLQTRPAKLLLALLAWMVLATPGALVLGVAAHRVVTFAQTVSVVLMMAAAVRIEDVERLAGAYFGCIAVFGAVILTRFHARFNNLYYYDGNDFGTVAVMAIPLGVYFATTRRPLLHRLVAGAALLALADAFVKTESRGGFIALVVVMAFLLVRSTAIPAWWRIATAAAIALLIAATASGQFWERMKSVTKPDEDYNMTGEYGRIEVWKRGAGYALSHPLLGVGPGNFPSAEGRFSAYVRHMEELDRATKWSAPHDIYVQMGAELGFPGLALFLAVVGSGLAVSGLSRRLAAAPAGLAQALGAGLLGFAIGGIFLSLAYADALYVLFGLVLSLRKAAPA